MICRVYQCIQEFGHPEMKQRCRLIQIIHYLRAKIEPKRSYIRVILQNRISIHMYRYSENIYQENMLLDASNQSIQETCHKYY